MPTPDDWRRDPDGSAYLGRANTLPEAMRQILRGKWHMEAFTPGSIGTVLTMAQTGVFHQAIFRPSAFVYGCITKTIYRTLSVTERKSNFAPSEMFDKFSDSRKIKIRATTQA